MNISALAVPVPINTYKRVSQSSTIASGLHQLQPSAGLTQSYRHTAHWANMHCAFLVVAVLRTTHAFIVSQPRVLAKTPSPRRRPLHLSTDDEAPTTTLELVATNGGRLDAVLAEAYPERSRSEWGDFVKLGYVRVNDTPCTKKAATVKDRDAIVVELPASTLSRDETTCIAEDLPLDLLLEDDHLLVVNKEAGMVTHPAPGHRTGTLANAVAGYCADDAEGMESGRPGIVHRLDRFTSGCVVVARDSEARRSLQKQFADRTVSKCTSPLSRGRRPRPMQMSL